MSKLSNLAQSNVEVLGWTIFSDSRVSDEFRVDILYCNKSVHSDMPSHVVYYKPRQGLKKQNSHDKSLNSLRPSDAYTRQWTNYRWSR